MVLLNDMARCPGWGGGPDDWLDECHDCLRRQASSGEQTMQPPPIVVFVCEAYIEPDSPENQRLRELAKRQGLVG